MRALSNQVQVILREDLEEPFAPPIRINKKTGAIEPRPVYGEVLSVGPGDWENPDKPDLKRGDIVVWDLSKIGLPALEHGKNTVLLSFNALLGKLYNPKTEAETCQPLFDYVLTERAPMAMQRAMTAGGIIIPGSVLADGVKERPGDNVVTCVYDRVIEIGPGIMNVASKPCPCCGMTVSYPATARQRFTKPDVAKGMLVAYNPLWGLDWRRRGRDFRFVPYSELRGEVEE